jgi:hypothetical protein
MKENQNNLEISYQICYFNVNMLGKIKQLENN